MTAPFSPGSTGAAALPAAAAHLVLASRVLHHIRQGHKLCLHMLT